MASTKVWCWSKFESGYPTYRLESKKFSYDIGIPAQHPSSQNKEITSVPALTVRNLPDETYRALQLRAAQHGRSTEAELRYILETAVHPKVVLGSTLAAIGRGLGGALSWIYNATPVRSSQRSSSNDFSGLMSSLNPSNPRLRKPCWTGSTGRPPKRFT